LKFISSLLLLIILSSCSTNNNIIGLYGKCEKRYFACTQIQINTDNTFECFNFMDVGGGHVQKGKWERISNDIIKLHTFDEPEKTNTYHIEKKDSTRLKGIKISVKYLDLPISDMHIFINDENEGKFTDINGEVVFQSDNISSIKYQYQNEINEPIIIENQNFNEIEIHIGHIEILELPLRLNNKTLKIKNNTLYFDEFLLLKKNRIENKQWN